MAKGLVVDGDVEFNDFGDNFDVKEDEYGADPNTGYSIQSPTDAPTTCGCSRRGGSPARSATGMRMRTTSAGCATWSDATSRQRRSS